MKNKKRSNYSSEQLKHVITLQDKKYAIITNTILFLITVCILLVYIETLSDVSITIKSPSTLFFYTLFAILQFLILNKLLTFLHEWVHKVSAAKYNHKAEIKMKKSLFSIDNDGKVEYRIGTKFHKKQFNIIVISPFIVLTILFIANFLLINAFFSHDLLVNLVFFVIFIYKINGCYSDITMFLQANFKCEANELLVYEGNSTFAIERAKEKESLNY